MLAFQNFQVPIKHNDEEVAMDEAEKLSDAKMYAEYIRSKCECDMCAPMMYMCISTVKPINFKELWCLVYAETTESRIQIYFWQFRLPCSILKISIGDGTVINIFEFESETS